MVLMVTSGLSSSVPHSTHEKTNGEARWRIVPASHERWFDESEQQYPKALWLVCASAQNQASRKQAGTWILMRMCSWPVGCVKMVWISSQCHCLSDHLLPHM